MATTMDQITAALTAGAKGVALGAAGGPIGMAIGGLTAIVSDIAPGALSSLLGNEAQAKLSAAAAQITGVQTEQAQVTALAKDPAATEAFRLQCLQIAADQQKADRQSQLDMMAATLEAHKVDLADTANARQSNVQLAQAGSKLAYGAPIVTGIVLTAFAVLVAAVVFHPVPDSNRDIANILLGTLGTMAANVVGFWTGSSSGSARKTELLASSVPQSVLPAPSALVPASDVQPAQ